MKVMCAWCSCSTNSPVLDPKTGMTLSSSWSVTSAQVCIVITRFLSLFGGFLPGWFICHPRLVPLLTVLHPRSGNIQTLWCVLDELFFRDTIPCQWLADSPPVHWSKMLIVVINNQQTITLNGSRTLSLDIHPPFESRDDPTPVLFVLRGLSPGHLKKATFVKWSKMPVDRKYREVLVSRSSSEDVSSSIYLL